MIIAKTVDEVREQVNQWKRQGLTVGLVPTMGFIHEGHASLVAKAKEMCDRVVASDFVNPTQFSPNEDLEEYPRDFNRDCQIFESYGCDMVFYPSVDEMYPDGNGQTSTFVNISSSVATELEGTSRPTMFRGVCTVVTKLFNIVSPDKAFFGEKDAQQLAVIKQMVGDLNFGIEIVGCPIVRDEDGLAKSSRNVYLSPEERQAALVLHKSIELAKDMVAAGERCSETVRKAMCDLISAEPLARIDYVSIVNSSTMKPIDVLSGEIIIPVAVFIGKTRLIDNCFIQVK